MSGTPLVSGTVLNERYRVVKLIAQGGFGAVYRAWDLRLNIGIALKELLDNTPEGAQQFNREALILAQLKHQNLPRVTDYFQVANNLYLVMDFIEGDDLHTRLTQVGRLSEVDVVQWLGQVSDALTYLHSQNPPIIHRDIKPANIKVTPQGQAVLVDFGIAKIYDPNSPTTKGARAISPMFSPPEQYGRGSTDARSDVYALGATAYILLTGELLPESVERLMGTPLTPPRQFVPSLSPGMEYAITKALELQQSGRWASVAEFKAAMSQTLPYETPKPPHLEEPEDEPPSGDPLQDLEQSLRRLSGGGLRTPPPEPEEDEGDMTDSLRGLRDSFKRLSGGGVPSPTPAPRRTPVGGGKTITVDTRGSGQYRTISEALEHAPANATIMVKPGVYKENLDIKKPVTILGDGRMQDIVLETSKWQCVDMLCDQSALIRGFTMRQVTDSTAINVGQGHLEVEDCDVTATGMPTAMIHKDSECTMRRVRLHDVKKNIGLMVYDHAKATFEDCEIFGHGMTGINIDDDGSMTVRRCKVRNNGGVGIRISDRAAATIEDSDITGNQAGAWDIEPGCRVTRNRNRD